MSSLPPSSPMHRASGSSSGNGQLSSPSINNSNPGETAMTVAAYKRRLATVESELAEATHPQPKRPVTAKTMGRGIRRLVTLFDNVSIILDEAAKRNTQVAPEPADADSLQMRTRDRIYRAYPLLLNLVPHLMTVVLQKSMGELNAFIADLQEGANGARSDDIKRVKEEVCARINEEYQPSVLLVRSDRENRGLQHDVCGRLLTPVMFNWYDLEVRAAVRGNKDGYNISSNYYLACLYGPGGSDINRLELNFLRSKLLRQACIFVYKCMFTSPSSAGGVQDDDGEPVRKKFKSARSTKSCVATLLNMDGKVTGRSIAYAAVLMVFNLTEAVQWMEIYNGFSFIGFYNFLVDYFEEKRSENGQRRVTELLAWWNGQIFPEHVTAAANSDESREMLLRQDDDY